MLFSCTDILKDHIDPGDLFTRNRTFNRRRKISVIVIDFL